MPIEIKENIRIFDQQTFADIAYEVMECTFHIHNKFGRFFSEEAYQQELAYLLGPRAVTEVAVQVKYADFCKTYFIDLLVDHGAIFEIKTVQRLTDKHRSQLLNYLLLTGCHHGKLINFRPEHVQHEFVNTTLTHADRTSFVIKDSSWDLSVDRAPEILNWVKSFLREWGAGLDLQLYVDALTHFLGGKDRVFREIDIVSEGRPVGRQRIHHAGKDAVFKFTAISDSPVNFEIHARRFLKHTNLKHLLWINVTRETVSMKTLTE